MGEKTLSFVEKTHEAAATNPTLVPPFLNIMLVLSRFGFVLSRFGFVLPRFGFVLPKYDGSHQTFPGLDEKRLGSL
jgi:hypothetical protein